MGNKATMTEDNVMNVLDKLYGKIQQGISHVSRPVQELTQDYLKRSSDTKTAIQRMQKYQIAKCTTSGVLTGLGGAITLPVAIPANISSVLYVQMRMIACTAYMAGFDVDSDQVRTLVYACLVGVSINAVAKKCGVEIGKKLTIATIKKIPRKVIKKINQRVGFRILTKFGEQGTVRLANLVPFIGGGVNGVLDFAETNIIAKCAYKVFVEGDLSASEVNQ